MKMLFDQFKAYVQVVWSQACEAEEGQTIVEYALLVVLVALAIAVASPNVTNAVLSVFSAASSALAIPGGS